MSLMLILISPFLASLHSASIKHFDELNKYKEILSILIILILSLISINAVSLSIEYNYRGF